ncbi:MAG: diguanylate cyclase, partial [Acidimicrobiia bacterium]|nr:diguanylate cyclase [Acidimicrobiia bacterium]
MSGNRFVRSPLLVLAAGVGATAVAVALIVSGGGFTLDEVTRASTVGLLCAAVTAFASAWQRHHLDRERRSLTQAEHDAKHDALTGLANRGELYRELEVSLRQAGVENTIFGVLFLDLDRFKLINDSMGHDVGDELLRIVAERLKAATRSSDVVARLGGDEFVLICRGLLSNDSVLAVVRQVLRSFTEPVKLDGHQQIISTSVGVAISTVDETRTPDELVRDADAAMYKAKREGSGFAVFDEAERSLLSNRLAVERDLGQAFDREQLVVYYQPIIDVEQQQLYGFEALIRWDHPERGLVSPAYFLPVAESARLMARLGELVLREACA